ncbi:MAG: VWA domain-containing protein [Solobacterium sp.]|nr:VWA domain-containing protein [Solobacterium sp.]
MNNRTTEIVYILDRSGSMSGLEQDTIGGFNAMMEKQKKEGGKAFVSTVLFDHRTEVLHDRLPLEEVPRMSEKEYFVRGSTALLDALGGAIHHIRNVHKYARGEDRPEKTLFIIATDGMENASTRYTRTQVRRMIEQERENHGWEFIFMGADIDAVGEAEKMGIRRERAVNYIHDGTGTANVFAGAAAAVCTVMRSVSAKKAARELDENGWSDELNKDYDARRRDRKWQ